MRPFTEPSEIEDGPPGSAGAFQELRDLETFLGERLANLRAAAPGSGDGFVRALEEIHAILSGGLQLVEARNIQRLHAEARARAQAERERAALARQRAAAPPVTEEEIPLGPDEMLLDYDIELEFLRRQELLPALILPTRLRQEPPPAVVEDEPAHSSPTLLLVPAPPPPCEDP